MLYPNVPVQMPSSPPPPPPPSEFQGDAFEYQSHAEKAKVHRGFRVLPAFQIIVSLLKTSSPILLDVQM